MKLKSEDVERAARQHLEGVEDDIERTLTDCCFPNGEIDDIHGFVTDAFEAGATWGVWMATKDLWHDAFDEEPEMNMLMLGLDDDGYSIYLWVGQEETWQEFRHVSSLRKWCYIRELEKFMDYEQ